MIEQSASLGYSHESTHARTAPETLLWYGVLLGLVLMGLAVVWVGILRGRDIWGEWYGTEPEKLILDVGLGLVIGGLISAVIWLVGKFYSGFVAIREKIADTLDLARFQWWHNGLLALLAAVPEEIFFRGAMQPVFGLWMTALIFGVLHSLTSVYFVYAALAGVLLGWLTEWHGNLWLPTATHFAIDFVALIILSQWARTQRLLESSTAIE